MTELERWMNDNPPLADALTAEETAALRQKVLARRPRLHALRGWRLAAAAAALCLVAAGAVVLGLFHPMSAANETNALVQKYGVVLDEPLTAEINGRTVSVKALLRGENTLRVLYDVDNAQGMEPNDLVWDTGAFYLRAADNSGRQAALYCKQRTGRAVLWVRHWFVGNAQRGQRRRRSLLLCGYSVDPDGHRHANAVYLRFDKLQGLCAC